MESKIVNMADFKNRATQIVRDVESSDTVYFITKHSVPVALIRALTDDEKHNLFKSFDQKGFLERTEKLRAKIAKKVKRTVNAVDVVRKERR